MRRVLKPGGRLLFVEHGLSPEIRVALQPVCSRLAREAQTHRLRSDGVIPKAADTAIGALLLGYYTPDGKLIYAGRVGTGMPVAELERLWQRLQPLAIDKMLAAEPPPRGTRFGSPLVLSRVHWVRPEMVAEVSYVEWTPDGLLRHVVYLGEREDKRATEVRRKRSHAGEL